MTKTTEDMNKAAIDTVYTWAKKKGYDPIKKPDNVSYMIQDTYLKLAIKDGKLVLQTSGPHSDEIKQEVNEVLGAGPTDEDFEDEPVDLSGKEVVPVEAPKPVKKQPTPKAKSEAKEQWKEYASKKDETYTVSGRDELSAFGVSKLMNEAGLCSEIVDSGRTKDSIWAVVRVTDRTTGQSREDLKRIDRETFWVMKAIDIAVSQDKKRAGFITGFDETGKPIVNPSRKVGGTPAPVWMAQQLIRSWHSADGIAVTGAERRAALKMLNRDWREDDEVQFEMDEANGVAEMKGA